MAAVVTAGIIDNDNAARVERPPLSGYAKDIARPPLAHLETLFKVSQSSPLDCGCHHFCGDLLEHRLVQSRGTIPRPPRWLPRPVLPLGHMLVERIDKLAGVSGHRLAVPGVPVSELESLNHEGR